MVPGSLLIILRRLFNSSDNKKQLAFIGQAILEQCRPRSNLAPLQLALAIQMHRMYGSRLLVDQLNSIGFASSYKTTLLYERSAAATHGTEIGDLAEDSFLQVIERSFSVFLLIKQQIVCTL